MLHNSNWQDTFLGGAILAGLIATAIVAACFTWVSGDHPQTAQHPKPVGSAIKATPLNQAH
jgi:hypothetical protein